MDSGLNGGRKRVNVDVPQPLPHQIAGFGASEHLVMANHSSFWQSFQKRQDAASSY
jgi:hypothetical protein